ncbi:general substrate transporter, partial [Atractiella rhizophila]
SAFQYGLDTGLLNSFQAMEGFLRVFGVQKPGGGWTIETQTQQLITSLLQVGLIVASAILGPLSKFMGRRQAVQLAGVISCIALTIQIFVTTKPPLYVARLLIGMTNGIYVNIIVLYISEISPPKLRGAFVSIYQPYTSIGGLIGAIISNSLKKNLGKASYRIALALLYAVPVWLFIFVFFIPESPRWLVVQDRNEEARRSLSRLRNLSIDDPRIEKEMQFIEEAVKVEKELAEGTDWRDMFRGTDRRRTLLTIACGLFHAASGLNFLVGYACLYFIETTPTLNSVGALISVFLARWLGRRLLLSTGFGVGVFTMYTVAILYTVAPDTNQAVGRAMVACLCIEGFTYSCTIGPLAWVAAGEMSSNRLRSWTFGVGMSVGFVGAWLTTFTTPYFIGESELNWGPKIGYIWGTSNLITFVFVLLFLPETKNLSLEKLDVLFTNKVHPWRFQSTILTHYLRQRYLSVMGSGYTFQDEGHFAGLGVVQMEEERGDLRSLDEKSDGLSSKGEVDHID